MELLPSELETFSFDKEIEGAPSVNRGMFSSPEDVLHVDCAGKPLQGWFVYCVTVGSLPQSLAAGDGKLFDFKPVHRPKTLCGAHSVISSYLKADVEQTYRMPTRPVKNALRAKLVSILSPCDVAPAAQSEAIPDERPSI
jgi:hypothetical protein